MSEFLERFFAGELGGLTLKIMVAAAIVLFLRALYGPRGLLRDARWDAGNHRVRRQEAERREARIKAVQEKGQEDAGSRDGR